MKEGPKHSILPSHLKSETPELPPNQKSHENSWYEKMKLWACLVYLKDHNPSDPLLKPCAIRSFANLSLHFWTNFKRSKDPEFPIYEGEEFLQNVVGFEG